mmetsp:Transcript_57627/g.106526  ORF Transcript_57627/g.106526 Transcript_57627/m.106526 type:complete len:348 (-) Transcript_57627:8-1051(-)
MVLVLALAASVPLLWNPWLHAALLTALAGVAGPHLVAALTSKVVRLLLADEGLCRDARAVLAEQLAAVPESDIAAKVTSEPMCARLQDLITAILRSEDFVDNLVVLAEIIARDQQLQQTIRAGVLDALQDTKFRIEVKELLIESLQDPELQTAILRALNTTVKAAIRESVEDTELKDVIVAAIREAAQDPRLKTIVVRALQDVLGDKEIYRATLKGAVGSVNPFQNGPLAKFIREARLSAENAAANMQDQHSADEQATLLENILAFGRRGSESSAAYGDDPDNEDPSSPVVVCSAGMMPSKPGASCGRQESPTPLMEQLTSIDNPLNPLLERWMRKPPGGGGPPGPM